MSLPSPINPFTCQYQLINHTGYSITWFERDPNNQTFCQNLGISDWCASPSLHAHQFAYSNTPVRSTGNAPLAPTCEQRIHQLINGGGAAYNNGDIWNAAQWRTHFYTDTGCPSYLNPSTQEWEFGCPLASPDTLPNFRDPSGSTNTGTQSDADCNNIDGDPARLTVKNCMFTYTCPLAGPDPNYYSICCSANNITEIQSAKLNIDPIATFANNGTATAISPFVCDYNLCKPDPDGLCQAMYDGTCVGQSPCHRHWYLTRKTQPSSDQLLDALGVVGVAVSDANDDGSTPIGGVDCWGWYQQTEQFAAIYGTSATFAAALNSSLSKRIDGVTNQIAEYCDDPRNYGQGECSCYLGITSAGANWGPPLQGAPSGFGSSLITTNTNFPLIVRSQGAPATGQPGQFQRYDAYCQPPVTGADPAVYNKYSQPFSYSTQSGQWITLSGPCSQSNTISQWSPLEYGLQTINPNKSIIPNYGDIVVANGGGFGFQDPAENQFPLPMPPHCWLPQCTSGAIGAAGDIVFRDLNAQALAGPCPNICYAVSGNQSTDINNYGPNGAANIGQNIVDCNFQNYTPQVDPFVLPCDCATIDLLVPNNYSGTLNLPIWNFQLDDCQLFSSTMLTATSALYPILGFLDNGTQTSQYISNISKYSAVQTVTEGTVSYVYPQTFVLSVSVNTYGQSAYNNISGALVLQNEQNSVMTIPTKLTIFNTTGPAICPLCDENFPNDPTRTCTKPTGQDSAARAQFSAAVRASSQVVTGLGANNDVTDVCIINGNQISNKFSSSYPYHRVTIDSLNLSNPYEQLLAAHTKLYGQVL